MSPHAAIHCPIGLFEQQEAKIEVLTQAINAAPTASGKAPSARRLIDEVQVLLDCVHYDRSNRDCGICRGFAGLRLQTASLIVRAGALEAER
jgi:hypothetical protein